MSIHKLIPGLFCIAAASYTVSGVKPAIKMVIDTEPGLDDAVAIVTALGRPDVEVLGLTCPNGNTDTENAAKNALRVLAAAGRLDIPVFKGSMLPLLGTFQYNGSADHFGKDGFGGADFSKDSLDMGLIQSKHAVLALLEFVNKNPGEITIVALGPLTNIALAIRLDPTFADKVKELHVMGGSATALGNKGPVSEFNFAWDPEAALTVLQEMHCPIYITTWELCIKYFLTQEQKGNLLSGDSNIARFLRKINGEGQIYSAKYTPYSICDSLSMTYALNNSVASGMYAAHATVELYGRHTRGEMIVDRYHLPQNVQILQHLHLDDVLAMIRKGILTH